MSEAAKQLDDQQDDQRQDDANDQQDQDQQIDTEALMAERDTKLQEKAKARGWMSFEEHVAAGRDPEEWRDARGFLDYGEMQSRIQKFQHGYEKKAQDDHKYFKALFEVKRKELEEKFNQAVDDGNPEEIRRAKKQLDEHEKTEDQVAQPAQQGDPVVEAWNRENSWIADPNDPRTGFAHIQWQQIANSGQFNDSQSALTELERRIAQKFPPEQRSRGHVPGSESGKGSKGFKAKDRPLTWSDLTEDEVKVFNTGIYGDDKDRFLKKTKSIRDIVAKSGE